MIHIATLAETLGKPLTANEVKALLGIGINQVYANAQEIGGVRIGKKWVFFESNVLAALRRDNADKPTKQKDGEDGMVREGDRRGENVLKEVRLEKRRAKMGGADPRRGQDTNRHGILGGAAERAS